MRGRSARCGAMSVVFLGVLHEAVKTRSRRCVSCPSCPVVRGPKLHDFLAWKDCRPRFMDAVVGGWQFSGLGRWTSGLPFSVVDGAGWASNWSYRAFMVQTGPISQKKTTIGGNPNAFADPAGALANMRLPYAGEAGQRNQFRGDGNFGIDAGLSKAWDTFENQKLEFRWEVFNVTNSVRFDVTSLNTGSTDSVAPGAVSFGNYTRTLVSPRVMQFSLRYSF